MKIAKTISFISAYLLLSSIGTADKFYTPERDKYPVEKPEIAQAVELPPVLLIGDSIMGGYFKASSQALKEDAVVFRHPGNAGETRNGLRKLDQWLGDTEWQVIHFNWGLHDLCYRHPEAKVYGKRDKVRGTISVPVEEYGKNLEKLVQRLKKTEAKLIFATITRIPEGEAGRFVGDDLKYNEVALKVMKRHGIPVNDLYGVSSKFGPDMYVKPGDVHHTGKANKILAEAVAEAVRKQLK